MDFTELIAKRRSIRRYAPGDIPLSDVERMADAARAAPSGKNLQYRHFIAVKNRSLIRAVGEAVSAENERICRILGATDRTRAEAFREDARAHALFFTDAPLLFVVMAKQYEIPWHCETPFSAPGKARRILEKSPSMQSLGAALAHLTLSATELGYSACPITSANYADASITALLRERADLNLPGYFMAALVAVGAPQEGQANVPEEAREGSPRKALSEILTVFA
jgi:nitroreductase